VVIASLTAMQASPTGQWMVDMLASVEAIASAFAKPVSDVRRLLALANLPDAAITALRAGAISFDAAKLLTTARDDDSRDALLRVVIAKEISDWDLRGRLRKNDIRADGGPAGYVGLAAYHAAGGTSTMDLFTDHTWLHDADLMTRLATEKAEAETEIIRASEGWAWAEYIAENMYQVCDRLTKVSGERVPLPDGDQTRLEDLSETEDRTDAEEAELEALERRAEATVFTDADYATCGITTQIQRDGTLQVWRAWRRKSDAAPAGDGSIDTHPAAPEQSMPENLRFDLRMIRLICIQNALRRDADLCQRLLAMQLAGLCPAYQEPFNFTPGNGYAHPAAGLPSKLVGFHIPAQLTAKLRDIGAAVDTAALHDYASVEALVTDGLARAFCRTDGPFVDAIHARVPITPRALWHPTAASFLSRVSAGYLNTLFRDLVPDDGSRHAGFATLAKKQKADELHRLFNEPDIREAYGLDRDTTARIDAWLPEELRFTTPAEPSETEEAA
jgi:ParB family chromosome partitioning protein